MLILRIGRGVIDHFPVRRSEWVNSFVMIGWGAVLSLDDLPLYGSWLYLSITLPEMAWATLFVCLGTFRLIILGINGSFPKSWYGKFAPHVRVAMSLLAALAWMQLVLAGMKAPVWSTGVVAYAGYFVSDSLNTLSASAEARELDKGRRDVAAGTIDAGQSDNDGGHLSWFGNWRRRRLRSQEPDGTDAN